MRRNGAVLAGHASRRVTTVPTPDSLRRVGVYFSNIPTDPDDKRGWLHAIIPDWNPTARIALNPHALPDDLRLRPYEPGLPMRLPDWLRSVA